MAFEDKLDFIKQYALPLGLGLAGLIFVGYGIFSTIGTDQKNDDILFESADKTETEEERKITVDVAGAVEKPGVYTLSDGARIQDALIKAGGMSVDADRVKIAKNLNLASKLTDSAKIYIPFTGEAEGSSDLVLGADDVSGEVGDLINVNTATVAQLDTLPNVGPITAGKIIANRPYEKIEDLVSKKAVGQATFEKIKDKISTY